MISVRKVVIVMTHEKDITARRCVAALLCSPNCQNPMNFSVLIAKLMNIIQNMATRYNGQYRQVRVEKVSSDGIGQAIVISVYNQK